MAPTHVRISLGVQENENEGVTETGGQRWKLRWLDDFRDEDLTSRLALNEASVNADQRSGAAVEKKSSNNGNSEKSTQNKSAIKPTPLLDKDGG